MVAASRDAQNLPADDADDAAGRSSPTCADDSKTLPCVRKCKKRLKKCMLPWEKKKCGKTSTEECLARYVCCIDDYCCKPCEDPLTCVPDCLPGTDGCCCEGKICNAGTCEPGPPTCVDPLTCDPVSICTTPGQDGCCCDGKICNAGTCEPGPPTCVDPLTCDPVSICTTPGQDGCCCDGKSAMPARASVRPASSHSVVMMALAAPMAPQRHATTVIALRAIREDHQIPE